MIRRSASNAISARVTWSRPCESVMRLDSLRSRSTSPGVRAACDQATDRLPRRRCKIFEPKPPPTSGEITWNLCSGRPRRTRPMIRRWTCGFWGQPAASARRSRARSGEAERGSMATGMSRWFTSRCLTRSPRSRTPPRWRPRRRSASESRRCRTPSSCTIGAPCASGLLGVRDRGKRLVVHDREVGGVLRAADAESATITATASPT